MPEKVNKCTKGTVKPKQGFPTSRDVYHNKTLLEGLTIGPLDKNKGELWMCCPFLYDKALMKAYKEGYDEVKPFKLKSLRGNNATHFEQGMVSNAPKQHAGSEEDILKLWKKIYHQRGWQKFATFNKRGGFNKPYILFKHKKVQDLGKRRNEWAKARPISPGTKHPMRKLLHLAGRAWSFIARQLEGQHFVINNSSEVPRVLQEASH